MKYRQILQLFDNPIVLVYVIIIACTGFVLTACSDQALPDNYEVTKQTARFEEDRLPADVIRVENCSNDAAIEHVFTRSTQVNDTVSLNQDQTQSIGVQAGLPQIVDLMVQLEQQVSEEYGAGLESGQAQTREVVVRVNPNRRAMATLAWIETWEEGSFTVYRDQQALGSVDYRLLKEIELDSLVQSYRCGWRGDLELRAAEFWSDVMALPLVQRYWPAYRLEVMAVMAVVVILVLIIVVSLLTRRRRRKRQDDYDFPGY